MAKLRLGVIGAGSWTFSSHLPNLDRHRDEVEFVIVNRRNPEMLGRIKDRFGFQKATTDWREVLKEDLDIVVVGSPPGYHYEQAKAALEAGAHVMCEKPFTLDPSDAMKPRDVVVATGTYPLSPRKLLFHMVLHEVRHWAQIAAAVRAKRLLRLTPDVVVLPATVRRCLIVLAALPQPFTAGQAREALGTTRKVVMPLLEHLAATGSTRRVDDGRHIVTGR